MLPDDLFCLIILVSVPQLRIGDAVHKYHRPGTHDYAKMMCTANYDGFYGTPSAQIFLCTGIKFTCTVELQLLEH